VTFICTSIYNWF